MLNLFWKQSKSTSKSFSLWADMQQFDINTVERLIRFVEIHINSNKCENIHLCCFLFLSHDYNHHIEVTGK